MNMSPYQHLHQFMSVDTNTHSLLKKKDTYSVIPHPCFRLIFSFKPRPRLTRSSTARLISRLNGAAPHPRLTTELRLYFATSGCFASATMIGGTPPRLVILNCSIQERKVWKSNLGRIQVGILRTGAIVA